MWKNRATTRRPRQRHRLTSEFLEARTLLAGDLVAHWQADSLNDEVTEGGLVTAWIDSIGGIPATAVGNPLLSKGVLSGRSAIQLEAADGADFFRVSAQDNVLSGAEDFSVSIAFTTDSDSLLGESGAWYENTGLIDSNKFNLGRGWGLSINQAGQVSAGVGAGFLEPVATVYSEETTLNDGGLHVATVARSRGTLSVYVDSGPAATVTDADPKARDSIELVIGALFPSNNPFSGRIAEVRVYDGMLTTIEVTQLHAQLGATYNNEAPVAHDDMYALTEDPLFNFVSIGAAQGLLSNDTDKEGDPLSVEIVAPPQDVGIQLNSNGSFNVIVPNDYFGSDTFTYTAKDLQTSNIATVTIDVANVYDAAVPIDDRYKLEPTSTLALPGSLGVLGNDLNPDRVVLQAELVSDVNSGSLTLNADGSLKYDPLGLTGEFTFSYRVHDQTQWSAPATATFVVNSIPNAIDDEFPVAEDSVLILSAGDGVLANDTDADGHSLTAHLIEGPLHGELILNEDGSMQYEPNVDYFGPDHFTYRVSDGADHSRRATVRLNVEAVNDRPSSNPDAFFTDVNQPLHVPAPTGLLRNDGDVDSTDFSAIVDQQPANGIVNVQVDGSFSYTPRPGFRGIDVLTYVADDGNAQSDPVAVTLFVGEPPVIISEFMAANAVSLETRIRADATRSFRGETSTPDWIELTNVSGVDFDISGFHLTDDADEAMKWSIPPGTVIPAGGRYLVFADRMNVRDPELDEMGVLHTNFKLDVAGEDLAMTSSAGSVVHAYPQYPAQRADVSYGLTSDGSMGYLRTTTPGTVNVDELYDGRVPETTLSVPRGFYETEFTVQIANSLPGSTIRFTTDGSEPTADHGETYEGPVSIRGTTVLKAAAFHDGYIQSPVTAHTYIFPSQVLLQDATPPEGALRWGHNLDRMGDYEMDPEIVNHADPELRPVVDDLLRLPTVSLSIDNDLFFGERDGVSGIYLVGENVEQPVAFEYFDPATPGTGIQTNSTIQIVGGSSPQRWKSDKLSMRVRFTEDQGESELEYPVFGAEAATRFDTLVVDARLNNVWHYGGGSDPAGQRNRGQYMRDEFAADLQNAVGGYATHAQHVHVYINGTYWGMHVLHERPDENFNASYQGGVAEEYNVIKHFFSRIVSGSNESYRALTAMLGAVSDLDLSDEVYAAAADLLDIDDFINYMLVNFYGGNQDWDHHNWYASQNPEDGKWRFHSWDAEKVLQSVNANVTSVRTSNAPTGIHLRMMTNTEYRLRFNDLVQKHFFNGGAMTPEAAANLYTDRSDQIDLVMRVESARWGDNQIDKRPFVRYTRQNWTDVLDGLLSNYFPRRTDIVVSQFERRDWFVAGQAPNFHVDGAPQHGGTIDPGARLTMIAPEGTIFFTTDGSDPRRVGGEISATAETYTDGLLLHDRTRVMARMRRSDGSWGPLSDARFSVGVPADATNLRISEIYYHPADTSDAEKNAGITDADDFEFIELVNIGQVPVDLSQVRFQKSVNGRDLEGVEFSFADGRVQPLPSGARVVVVEDLEAFQLRFGSHVNVAGQWNGGLNNASERIVLVTGDQTIADFRYSDDWHSETDGKGPSLQAVDEAGDPALLSTAAAWRPSTAAGGSPGRPDVVVAGDSNNDGVFSSADLVFALAAGKFEDNIPNNATFEEGDWDGDGDFTSSDFDHALATGTYILTEPIAAPVAIRRASSARFEVADSIDSGHHESESDLEETGKSVDAFFGRLSGTLDATELWLL